MSALPQRSVKSVRLHGLNNFRNLVRTPRTFSDHRGISIGRFQDKDTATFHSRKQRWSVLVCQRRAALFFRKRCNRPGWMFKIGDMGA